MFALYMLVNCTLNKQVHPSDQGEIKYTWYRLLPVMTALPPLLQPSLVTERDVLIVFLLLKVIMQWDLDYLEKFGNNSSVLECKN